MFESRDQFIIRVHFYCGNTAALLLHVFFSFVCPLYFDILQTSQIVDHGPSCHKRIVDCVACVHMLYMKLYGCYDMMLFMTLYYINVIVTDDIMLYKSFMYDVI